MMVRVLVLGGGVGGTIIANRLARKLRAREAHIVVIDATGQHVYQPGLLYLPFNKQKPGSLVRPIRRLLDKRVELIEGTVDSIDVTTQSVHEGGDTFTYDWLVLATGAQLLPKRVAGFSNAHHFYDVEHAVRLREALRNFKGGRIVVGPARKSYKCPSAPLEFILLLNDHLKQQGLRDRTELHYFSPFPKIFQGERIAQIVQPLFEERGIRTALIFNVKEINESTINSYDGACLEFDLAVVVPPHGLAPAISEAGLASGKWVSVDPYTLKVTEQEKIFALGDVTNLGIPKTGSVAHFQAQAVVDGLIAGIRGKGHVRPYSGGVLCLIETGEGRATKLSFDYNNPGQASRPNRFLHWAKSALNHLYWIAVPSGRM